MQRNRRTLLRAAAVGTTGLLAGCAGASENRQDAETTTDATAGTTDAATATTDSQEGSALPYTVAVATHPEHGVVLTDAEGMTLYLFTKDSRGESVCYDGCADAWPPLTVEEPPTVPEGLPGEVTTVERDDGSTQVAYGGMPLYYWQGDRRPGDATGQGVNDVWFVVHPSCEGASADRPDSTSADATETATDGGSATATDDATTAGGGTTSTGNGGYYGINDRPQR